MIVEIGQSYSKNKFPFNIGALLIVFAQKMLFKPKSERYSHFYIAFRSESGAKKYLDATAFTVRDRSEEKFKSEYDIRKTWCVKLRLTKRAQFIRWVERFEGKGYGFLQLIGIGLILLKLVKKNPFPKGMICNELVLTMLNDFTIAEPRIDNVNSLDLLQTTEILDNLKAKGRLKDGTV